MFDREMAARDAGYKAAEEIATSLNTGGVNWERLVWLHGEVGRALGELADGGGAMLDRLLDAATGASAEYPGVEQMMRARLAPVWADLRDQLGDAVKSLESVRVILNAGGLNWLTSGTIDDEIERVLEILQKVRGDG